MSTPEEKTPAQRLATPVQFLPGVGPRRAELFEKLGLHAAKDLLFFFPRDYEDLTTQRAVRELEEGSLQSVRGQIEDIDLRNTGTGRCVLGVLVRAGGDYLRAIWFNQPFMREKFALGQKVVVLRQAQTQRPGLGNGPPPRHDAQRRRGGALAGIPARLSAHRGAAPVGSAADHPGRARRLLPAAWTRSCRRTSSRHINCGRSARPCRELHFPASEEESAAGPAAVRLPGAVRFAVGPGDEAAGSSFRRSRPRGWRPTPSIDARIRRLFPFELTAGQQQAIAEIAADMACADADEPPAPGRRGQRQDDRGRVCHAPGRGPRLSGGADGPHRGPRPAARPDAPAALGRQARSAACS